jgi:hypothetical protein
MIKYYEYLEEHDMKKIVFFCLIVLFIFGCSSGADKPKESKQAPQDSTVQAEKTAPVVTSVSGDYVYIEVKKTKFKHEGQEYESIKTDTYCFSFPGSGSVIYKVNTKISIEPEATGFMLQEKLFNVYAVGSYTIRTSGSNAYVTMEFQPQDKILPYVSKNKKELRIADENTLIEGDGGDFKYKKAQ